MQFRRLFSVDPSLTCSGWALFEIKRGRLIAVGKIKSLQGKIPLASRYENIQDRVSELFERLKLSSKDVLVCEAETTMRDPRAAFKVEHVRSVFEAVARIFSVRVPGRINPRTVQSELLGLKGRQSGRATVKAAAVQVARTLYSKDLSALGFGVELEHFEANQDIVDAILIGNIALSRIKTAAVGRSSIEEVFAVQRGRRRGGRYGWGKGESNSFGWTAKEIKGLRNVQE